MGRIYSYKDLRGVVQVGWRVRAVPGKYNTCGELRDDGSNTAEITAEITKVTGTFFRINNCEHFYDEDNYLEHIEDEPAQPAKNAPKTLYNLEAGDVVKDKNGDTRKIIDVLPHSLLISQNFYNDYASGWYTPKELEDFGYTVQPTTPTTELTREQIAEKFGVPVEQLRIKE